MTPVARTVVDQVFGKGLKRTVRRVAPPHGAKTTSFVGTAVMDVDVVVVVEGGRGRPGECVCIFDHVNAVARRSQIAVLEEAILQSNCPGHSRDVDLASGRDVFEHCFQRIALHPQRVEFHVACFDKDVGRHIVVVLIHQHLGHCCVGCHNAHGNPTDIPAAPLSHGVGQRAAEAVFSRQVGDGLVDGAVVAGRVDVGRVEKVIAGGGGEAVVGNSGVDVRGAGLKGDVDRGSWTGHQLDVAPPNANDNVERGVVCVRSGFKLPFSVEMDGVEKEKREDSEGGELDEASEGGRASKLVFELCGFGHVLLV